MAQKNKVLKSVKQAVVKKAPVVAKLPHKIGDYFLKFGGVNSPVILYTAAREEKIELHMYHTKCNKQVKRLGEYCPECAEAETPEALDDGATIGELRLKAEEIYKGFDAKGKIVPVTDADIDSAKPESGKVLEIIEFVSAEDVDPIAFDASFYLAPNTGIGAGALRIFKVIREAMVKTDKIAVARMVLSKSRREELAFIAPYGDEGMILYSAYMADEVRKMEFPTLPEVKAAEVNAAASLIDAMSAEWDPTKYSDAYRSNILALIAAKKDGVDVPQVERKPVKASSDDLLSLFEASVKIAKEQRKAMKQTA